MQGAVVWHGIEVTQTSRGFRDLSPWFDRTPSAVHDESKRLQYSYQVCAAIAPAPTDL